MCCWVSCTGSCHRLGHVEQRHVCATQCCMLCSGVARYCQCITVAWRGMGHGMWGLEMKPEDEKKKERTKKGNLLLLLMLVHCCGMKGGGHWAVGPAEKVWSADKKEKRTKFDIPLLPVQACHHHIEGVGIGMWDLQRALSIKKRTKMQLTITGGASTLP